MTNQGIIRIERQETGLSEEGNIHIKKQLDLLENLVKTVLRKDEDYGAIPGTGNKRGTLLKPGAANVTAAFNCHAEPHIDTAVVDPEKGAHGFVNYEVHVDIISNQSGAVMARGYGNCNSFEGKYRYRTAQPKCPRCGQENIRPSRQGDGYYCWAKTGGCGATFKPGDQAIETQAVGKVENENPLDMANTIKKMAIKRAEVDAAMRLPGVARFFTQDLEDMADALSDAPAQKAAPASQQPAVGQARPQAGVSSAASAAQAPSAPVTQKLSLGALGQQFADFCRRAGWDDKAREQVIKTFDKADGKKAQRWADLTIAQAQEAIATVTLFLTEAEKSTSPQVIEGQASAVDDNDTPF